MRSVYATFLSLVLLSLSATAANPRLLNLSMGDTGGKDLRACLEMNGEQLLLRVDDASAQSSAVAAPWVQEAMLTTTDDLAGNFNDIAVAIDGNTVVVTGAFLGQSAYVFVKPSTGWHSMTQTARLTPSTSAASSFGHSLAVSGNTIVVGAAQETIGSNADQGAVYVFVEPAGGWVDMTETAKLTASDGGTNDLLGVSVAISGNVIVAGAIFHKPTGAAYLFVRPAGGWVSGTQTAELTGSTDVGPSEVGDSVAISGGAVVAATGLTTGVTYQGGALVFVKPSTGWADMTQTAALGTGVRYLSAVRSVGISNDTVVGGASDITVNGKLHAGGAFVWVKPNAGWSNMPPTAQLTASDGAANDGLGAGVGINGTVIIAGAPRATVNSKREAGAVYVFNKPASGWTNMTETSKVARAGGMNGDEFGFSAGISGGTIVGVAPFANQGAGASYIFGQ